MVCINILSGKQAGASRVIRRFPVRIGRSAASDIQFEEDGIWDEHLLIGLNPAVGFVLETQGGALVTTNGQPVQHAPLRNGDIIEIGALKMQFWLAEARQRGLRFHEALAWALIFAVAVGQAALICWLVRS